MKTYSVNFMPDAIKDLENIYEYISEQGGFPERAWRYMKKLKLKCQELETFPIRGRPRNDLMNGLRVYPLDRRTVAAFLVDEAEQTVCILNIFYGGRDYGVLLDSSNDAQ
ncbi:MAG: type II toxin-antitoxin system RelE/ParE family toxin [Desulfobulbaceae bacterium]|nr:type II toxin-antitoxin system RelE/ParE family toxin [Desulfobulbaceae bacterium]